jgi:hypothetical protein
MNAVPTEERTEFPTAGARARMLRRFERDLEAWLRTAEGRFAVYTARTAVEPAERGSGLGGHAGRA